MRTVKVDADDVGPRGSPFCQDFPRAVARAVVAHEEAELRIRLAEDRIELFLEEGGAVERRQKDIDHGAGRSWVLGFGSWERRLVRRQDQRPKT